MFDHSVTTGEGNTYQGDMGRGVAGVTQVNTANTAHPNPLRNLSHISMNESRDGSLILYLAGLVIGQLGSIAFPANSFPESPASPHSV